jgi:anti-anti-sigma regulatory factor
MGAKFSSELTSRDGVTTLKLVGVVDEDNELVSLESKLSGGPLVLDLSEIDRINSCGVRDWVNWLGRIEKNGARPVFISCSPAIVAQINLVHNFTAGGIVKSFYAPYYCPRCEKEKLLRLETRDLLAQAPITNAPTCRCDECDGPMEFDDMEESYFAFLNNAKKVLGDPSYEQTMREIAAASEGGGRMRPRSTGASIPPVTSTSPGATHSTPASPVPGGMPNSGMSPPNRTPTGKMQPINPPSAGSQGQTPISTIPPRVNTQPVSPVQSPVPAAGATPPMAAAALVPSNTGSVAKQSSSNPITKPAQKPLLPWVLLGMFLLTAVGLLLFVLTRK